MARPKQNQTPTPQQPPEPKRKLTFHDFRVWLSGVEEMQDGDWTPSSSQWRTIRDKIEDVIETPSQPRRVIEYDGGGYDEHPIRPQGPSAFSGTPVSMAPPSTALAVEKSIVVSDAVPAGGVKSGGLKVKTPNIDTSTKPYVAAFE